MPLVNAKCTNCGASLKVDSNKDAAICEHCGSAYIVEKAVNNYNIEHVSLNVNSKRDLQSIKILAYEALKKENYKKASKFFYELFMQDHSDVISKYFYQISEALIPLTEAEERILYFKPNHPRHDDISLKNDEKDALACEATMGLTRYCLENEIFKNREIADVVYSFLERKSSIIFIAPYNLIPFLQLLIPYSKEYPRIKILSRSLAEEKVADLLNEANSHIDTMKYSIHQHDIDFSRRYYPRCLRYTKEITALYPDIPIPKEMLYSSQDLENLIKTKYERGKPEKPVEKKPQVPDGFLRNLMYISFVGLAAFYIMFFLYKSYRG